MAKEQVVEKKSKKQPYFKSNVKGLSLVLKQPEVIYTKDGAKVVKSPAIVVRFRNFMYRPKTEEEKKLLIKLSEKRKDLIKYISVSQQEKDEELKKEIEKKKKELDEKYAKIESVEKQEAVQGLKKAE